MSSDGAAVVRRGARDCLCALVLLLAVSGCGGSAAPVDLIGSVGPTFVITLTEKGRPVTRLQPGRYSITVFDRSSFLNFHLFGPGVNEATSITGTGTSRWIVTLKPGLYHYQCDAHRSLVYGSFVVT